jgi:hypothetical protein
MVMNMTQTRIRRILRHLLWNPWQTIDEICAACEVDRDELGIIMRHDLNLRKRARVRDGQSGAYEFALQDPPRRHNDCT